MIKRTGPYEGILHEVVENDGVLYLAGIVTEDASLDMAGQMKDITRQIDQLLAANGSHKDKILSVMIYTTAFDEKPAMNAVWKAWLSPNHLPARATIGVAELGQGIKLEVVVTAAK
ncbi:MAG: RidA family protein [Alphaproteobacteria bacterium]